MKHFLAASLLANSVVIVGLTAAFAASVRDAIRR